MFLSMRNNHLDWTRCHHYHHMFIKPDIHKILCCVSVKESLYTYMNRACRHGITQRLSRPDALCNNEVIIIATVFLKMQSVKRGLCASEHHGKTQYQKAGGNNNASNWRQISKREQEQAGGKQAGSTKLSWQDNKKKQYDMVKKSFSHTEYKD